MWKGVILRSSIQTSKCLNMSPWTGCVSCPSTNMDEISWQLWIPSSLLGRQSWGYVWKRGNQRRIFMTIASVPFHIVNCIFEGAPSTQFKLKNLICILISLLISIIVVFLSSLFFFVFNTYPTLCLWWIMMVCHVSDYPPASYCENMPLSVFCHFHG